MARVLAPTEMEPAEREIFPVEGSRAAEAEEASLGPGCSGCWTENFAWTEGKRCPGTERLRAEWESQESIKGREVLPFERRIEFVNAQLGLDAKIPPLLRIPLFRNPARYTIHGSTRQERMLCIDKRKGLNQPAFVLWPTTADSSRPLRAVRGCGRPYDKDFRGAQRPSGKQVRFDGWQWMA